MPTMSFEMEAERDAGEGGLMLHGERAPIAALVGDRGRSCGSCSRFGSGAPRFALSLFRWARTGSADERSLRPRFETMLMHTRAETGRLRPSEGPSVHHGANGLVATALAVDRELGRCRLGSKPLIAVSRQFSAERALLSQYLLMHCSTSCFPYVTRLPGYARASGGAGGA